MHPYPLDPVDRTLLNALQRDGRATVGDLAEAVALSTSPCWRRVRALEDAGVIAGYHAHLHRQRVGWGVLGFVQLALHDHTAETTSALEREVMAMPQVLSCHNLSGRYDYQLEVVAADLESFADYVRTHVRSLPALCHFEWNLTSTLVPSNTEIKWSGRGKGVGGQVLELGHAQVGNGDEVAHRPEAPCCRLGLLQQAVHGFHVGI